MTEMEEDKRELCRDLPNGSEIELVDATAQQEQPIPSKEDRNSAQNGQSHSSCPETNEDKDLDLRDSGNQVMRDETANGDVKGEDLKANDGQTKGDDFEEIKGNDNDASPSEPLEESKANATESGLTRPPEESIVNGSIAHQEVCRPKADSTPLLTEKVLAPKAEDKKVEEVKTYYNDIEMDENEELGASEDGTPAEQAAFMKELENFHIEKALEFKAPKFYGLPLNCLKLWRAVIRLGGYDVVTSSKLWRQVGESFHPPKTCTTVSWTFRIFYEKALLEYEKHKRQIGELQLPVGPLPHSNIADKEPNGYHTPGSGRARRDAAARAMQGWHAQRLIGYGEISEPIIKDKSLNSSSKREKSLKSIGLLKHKTSTNLEHAEKTVNLEADKQVMANVVDIGPPADWVKINVRENKDCFEVYALVPGFLREEVRVQSDPAGRLVITGQPEHLDNPWGITPFRKVVSLPARIDPLHTSAVVSLHGRLFVRVPFELGSV